MPLPVPNPPPERKSADIPSLINGLDTELRVFRRAMAGYTKLNAAWDQMTHGVPEGDRVVGVPMFKYVASDVTEVEGTKAIECVIELKKLQDQSYAPHILAAFCQIHGAEMLESMARMAQYAGAAYAQLQAALGVQPAQPGPAVPLGPAPTVHTQPDADADEDEGEEVVETPRASRQRRSHE